MPIFEVQDKGNKKLPIHYEVRGQGTPMVLIHGWLCNMTFWDDFLPLAAEGYQLILIDLRGHGETPVSKEYSIPRFAEDIAQLLDSLQIDKAIIIGHSMGGLTAQAFYEKYPDRVLALGLWNTGATLPLGYGIGTLFYVFRIFSFVTGLLLSYPIPPLFRFVLTQGWKLAFKDKGKSEAYRKFVPSVKALSPKGVMKAAFALPGYNARKVLPTIKVPVMLLHGTADRNITPIQLYSYLQNHIPETYGYETDNAAHFPPNECPEETLGFLKDFLGKIKL
jgi:pimeloyl-ACP methyl ester carboxylesterase